LLDLKKALFQFGERFGLSRGNFFVGLQIQVNWLAGKEVVLGFGSKVDDF
jgi:hypothetical protein